MKPTDEKPGWSSTDETLLLIRARTACFNEITILSCQSRETSTKIQELCKKLQPQSELIFLMDEDASDMVQLTKLKEEKSKISVQLRKAYQKLGSIEKALSELQVTVQPGEPGS
ncbi:uncharacterized protein LAJ45_03533 [Morchella importuna]|uniref:uncharacterized protein n=1 Tax=Morchella importuna TaxID=1174673 RepID=UPI001E8CD075|nr:uncharacterized protein LAJ45_03533 [Morchella importuna]KAH8152691.1 hypothetical protein LAJ45_03533 [Morchella importuna]